MKNEIILYRPDEIAEHIEVRLEEETVWLSQQQMATLFNQTKQNISLHINNCFKEGELEKISTVKESLTVQKEGNRSVKRKIEYYNLDVIISVGYRVKSNEQYGGFEAKAFTQSHDRFLIIDGKEVYHLGASLKDLGKKWFAFSKMEAKSVKGIMKENKELI
jgi:hypothetical protein